MVRIGIVGVGFMGMIHYLAACKVRGGQVTAICSRDKKKLAGDWRSIRGNFGPKGEMMDLSSLKKYETLDALLADPDIDMVDICNPTEQHPETAIKALQAGKHVLVEKAIAIDPNDADRMLQAARKSGKLLMVAHVLPFFPEFKFAAEIIRSGQYGKVIGGHFRRIISKPDWSAEIGDAGKTGGPAIDLHIHDTHFIGLVCGVPRKVFSSGVVADGAVTYLTTNYLYGSSGPCISCSSGAVAQKAREFTHGYEIYLEKATLVYEIGAVPLTVLKADGTVEKPQLSGGDDPISSFTAEIQAALDACMSGTEPALLSGKLARDALVLCHKECASVRSGQPVDVD